ncbi:MULTISPECIES: membrane protein insertase YidC [unclassified Aminobacter]|uniref:membrane protein insertase YidC n=1 Tax=unclassified Aminobacter TaxID=2644704 RepID=UPI0004652F8C|nr:MULTISPECIES: membrane protein insertase YidC [unclassified Aminobacter]TWG53724.1 YidC/Oxa1 family membrane protein insertase [Aminobacter sp. J44]TWH28130.1 YidC/Oxa1 family membrane protein insertase [Aminobacter sp. J15]
MENNRNFFITIAISVAILVLWQVFYMNPRIEAQREAARIEQEQAQAQQAEQPGATPAPATSSNDVPGQGPAATVPAGAPQAAAKTREAALAASSRIQIDTPRIAGSINLVGGRIDDLILKDYRTTVEKDSPNIELLNPSSRPDGYFAEFGFVGSAETGSVPGPSTVWTVEGNPTLTPATPVTLTYTNDRGLTFTRTIAVDNDYMFTISDAVANAGEAPVSLSGYGRVARIGTPATQGFYILHEGLIGVTGTEGLQEIDYSDLAEKRQIQPGKSEDGWLGITDKYWAVAMVPSGAQAFQPRFAFFNEGGERYQADYLTDPITVAPGQSHTLETLVFAGAKETAKIDAYEAERGIRQFDLLIDWGWFYFITKPMFYLIDWLFHALGNFGLAILATTVIVKAVFFPLANKSYKSMANMKMVQPQLQEIRERYADDRMKQQQAMMELYKTAKINPLAGCWPIVIQIPVFFALYKVLYVTIEMRHAPFFGWIRDLSAPDPTSLFNLFGLLPYDVPAVLLIGVWPIIMGITMFLQMRMNPTPPDPTQAMIFNWMPVIFTFMLASFPAGLVIYWAWNNLLSITQQAIIMKRQGAKIELWDNLVGLFKKKPKPAE